MCPASCGFTENCGLIVNGCARGISLNCFSAACRFRNSVKRKRRLVLAVAFFRDVLRVLFLQVGRVGKQELAQFVGRCVGIERPSVAEVHQPRHVTGVIDVRMRQHHPIDRRGINGRVVPVSLLELVRTLKQAAVHQ